MVNKERGQIGLHTDASKQAKRCNSKLLWQKPPFYFLNILASITLLPVNCVVRVSNKYKQGVA